MGNLKTRLDKAEAEAQARLEAERDKARGEFWTFFSSLPEATQRALWRNWRARWIEHGEPVEDDEMLLADCGGVLEVQPGDLVLVEAVDLPEDLARRMIRLGLFREPLEQAG